MAEQVVYAEAPPPGCVPRRIDAAGTRLGVWERSGHGPALLFVHGNSASKAAFRDLIGEPALAGRRIVSIDLPGSGESANAGDEQYTIPAFACTLIEAADRLSLNRPIVLGWSLGGHIALEAVGQRPDVLRALVLTGTPPCGPGAGELAETFHAGELAQVVSAESPPPELLDAYVRALYGKSRPIPGELFEAAKRCHGRMRRLFAEHWLSGIEGVPQRRVISRWPGAIAAIQGDEEPFFDPALLNTLNWRNLWRGESQYVRGAGHAPFFERPDRYAALLAEFLQNLSV